MAWSDAPRGIHGERIATPIDWRRVGRSAAYIGVVVAALITGYTVGLNESNEMLEASMDREDHLAELSNTLLDQSVRALSVVLREDARLHRRIHDSIPGLLNHSAIVHAVLAARDR
ncbi:MAG: hypothetical protein AAF389_15025 [Gemmatimonadota bacterium]